MTNLQLSVIGKKSTKGFIVALLSEEWPLSARQIFSRIKNNENITYQAIHKSLKELEQEKILLAENKSYRLNFEWIEGKESYFAVLKKRYLKEENVLESKASFVLESVTETDQFLLELAGKIVENSRLKPELYMHWIHFWMPLFLDKEAYASIKYLAGSVAMYAVTPANTPIDQWCANFWAKNMAHVKSGVSATSISDTIVCGDFVVQVFYPEAVRNKLNELFESAKKVEDVDWDYYYKKIFEAKANIPVLVNKNPELANIVRKEIKSWF